MKSFIVFIHKEFIEFIKVYKVLILFVAFIACAIISPITAYFIPKLFEVMGITQMNAEFNAMFGKATMFLSYSQLFSNLVQIGLLTLLFLSAGAISSEKSKGTAVMILTKHLSRASFVLSKFIIYCLWYTISFIASFLIYFIITQILFNECINWDVIPAISVFWLSGIFIISISIFASCVTKKYLGSALIAFCGYVLMTILATIPKINQFSPGFLVNAPLAIMRGNYDMTKIIIPVIISIIISTGLLISGIMVFNRQEI